MGGRILCLAVMVLGGCEPSAPGDCSVKQTAGGGAVITCPGAAPVTIPAPETCTIERLEHGSRLACSGREDVLLHGTPCRAVIETNGETRLDCDGVPVDPGSYRGAGTIAGSVILLGEESAAAATVALLEPGIAATVEPDGTFALEDVPAGTHVLEVTAPGFFPKREQVTIRPGQVVLPPIELRRSRIVTRSMYPLQSLPGRRALLWHERGYTAAVLEPDGTLGFLPQLVLGSVLSSSDGRYLWDRTAYFDRSTGARRLLQATSGVFASGGAALIGVHQRGGVVTAIAVALPSGSRRETRLETPVSSVVPSARGAFVQTGFGTVHVSPEEEPVLLGPPGSQLARGDDLLVLADSRGSAWVLDPAAGGKTEIGQAIRSATVAPGSGSVVAVDYTSSAFLWRRSDGRILPLGRDAGHAYDPGGGRLAYLEGNTLVLLDVESDTRTEVAEDVVAVQGLGALGGGARVARFAGPYLLYAVVSRGPRDLVRLDLETGEILTFRDAGHGLWVSDRGDFGLDLQGDELVRLDLVNGDSVRLGRVTSQRIEVGPDGHLAAVWGARSEVIETRTGQRVPVSGPAAIVGAGHGLVTSDAAGTWLWHRNLPRLVLASPERLNTSPVADGGGSTFLFSGEGELVEVLMPGGSAP